MIDISFDFRSDSKGRDPDTYSPTLNAYHRALWSKELPNGQVMELQSKSAPFVLNWRDFYFTSDTIIVEMSYSKNRKIMDRVYEQVEDFEEYYQHLLHRSYTIGSMIIFPVHANSMNQRRGTNIRISDRWDLTLECIRRHYAGEESPLSKVIETDKSSMICLWTLKDTWISFSFRNAFRRIILQSIYGWEMHPSRKAVYRILWKSI